ncbi:MAG TPA: hypothetical protein PLV41_00965 [Miltoncostaeales bacterium]|jgi:hypothetical protein|nr:hypothetical protein [Miltoncostaeales bacterium]
MLGSEITLRVDPGEVGQNVLRRTVRAVCAPTTLPLDRVDDLLIICDELLAHDGWDRAFTLTALTDGVRVIVREMDAGPIVPALASSVVTDDGQLAITVLAR